MLCGGEDFRALFRQLHAMHIAGQQRHAQVALEVLDLAPQRIDGLPKLLRGCAKPSATRDFQEYTGGFPIGNDRMVADRPFPSLQPVVLLRRPHEVDRPDAALAAPVVQDKELCRTDAL